MREALLCRILLPSSFGPELIRGSGLYTVLGRVSLQHPPRRGPWLERSEMSESYAELLERLEATKRSLRGALKFINDNRHLTDEGIAAREALLREIEAIEQDLEAIRQEHGLS